jgi:multidrug efflux system outer membrane protein
MMQHRNFNAMKPVYVVVAALFLSGCQSIWPDYLRPKLDVPAQYVEPDQQNATENLVANNWWTLYEDQELNALVEKALNNNKDIKIAVARIDEADAALREVGGFLYPQIDLNSGARRSRVSEAGANQQIFNNPRSNYNVQLGTTFELDFWGKLRRAKEAARAQALSSRYARDTVALSLTGLVASNYLTLRSLESQIAIAQENLKSRDNSLALTKRRLEGGVASALDVQQAQVASSNLSAQIADLNRLKSLTLHQLAVLSGDLNLAVTGLNAKQADLKALPIPPTPPAGLPSSLLEARPDVKQAEEQMIAANANIGVAKAALYPTISLTATFGGESMELADVLKSAARIWSGGLTLNLPIFDGGKLNAKVDQASARQKQTLASYEGAIQNAFREVNDALVNLRQYTEREQALYTSQAAAKKALELSENRYQSGYSSYIDVLEAQRAYNDSGLAFVQSRQARLIASVDLFKALGGGWHSNGNK